jgi:hypothetical protein
MKRQLKRSLKKLRPKKHRLKRLRPRRQLRQKVILAVT